MDVEQLPLKTLKDDCKVAHFAQIVWPGRMNAFGGVFFVMTMNGDSAIHALTKGNAVHIHSCH
jgi:hypothetical protein